MSLHQHRALDQRVNVDSLSEELPAARSRLTRAIRIGSQGVGALAIGAAAIGALAIGTIAIGRLVIGRTRIRRLEIDELVVRKLQVTDVLQMPPKPGS